MTNGFNSSQVGYKLVVSIACDSVVIRVSIPHRQAINDKTISRRIGR